MKKTVLPLISLLSLTVIFSACGGARRQTGLTLPESRDDAMISLASLAPSGHNAQPWKVRVEPEGCWIIGWDRSRALQAVDPANRELVLSLGAFCEAASIAASSYGLDAKIAVTAQTNFDAAIAKISFSQGNTCRIRLDALKKRRTIRKGILSKPLSPSDKNDLARVPQCRMHVYDRGSAEAAFIEKAVLESNITQANRADAVCELSQWIRWKDADAVRQADGLTPEGMEITGIAGFFVRHFFSSGDVKTPAFKDATISTVRDALSSYGCWIILETDDSTPASLIGAGRDFLNVALAAQPRLIALHPMTQPLEEKVFEEALKRNLGLHGDMQFILRAGYVDRYPDPVTFRIEPSAIRQ